MFLNKVTLLITTELVNGHTSTFSILGKLIFHTLAELTPRSIHGNNGLLTTLDNLQCLIVRCNILNLTILPQVTIEGLFGTGNVDTTFSLGGSILIGKSNESSLTFRCIVEPWCLVSLKLEVNEASGSIFGDGDSVLGITVLSYMHTSLYIMSKEK